MTAKRETETGSSEAKRRRACPRYSLKVGELATNCYILADESPEALIIDAGGDADEIIARLEVDGLTPTLLVVTHGHADHIAANTDLKARYPEMEIAIGREDAGSLGSVKRNMSLFIGRKITSPPADRLLDEGDVVDFAGWRFRVIETPGHTPGGICLYTDDLDGAPALFSGDTVFAGSVGRCDIPDGEWDVLIDGIRRKILTLPDETVIYPGHGPATTVGEERESNPFLTQE